MYAGCDNCVSASRHCVPLYRTTSQLKFGKLRVFFFEKATSTFCSKIDVTTRNMYYVVACTTELMRPQLHPCGKNCGCFVSSINEPAMVSCQSAFHIIHSPYPTISPRLSQPASSHCIGHCNEEVSYGSIATMHSYARDPRSYTERSGL